jgi:cytochrome P450
MGEHIYTESFVIITLASVKEDGAATPSFLLDGISNMEKSGTFNSENINDLKYVAMTFSAAGGNTTRASLLNILLLLVLYPSVLREAQAEMDTVVGRERLPNFDDRPQLRYLECVIQESLRRVTCYLVTQYALLTS